MASLRIGPLCKFRKFKCMVQDPVIFFQCYIVTGTRSYLESFDLVVGEAHQEMYKTAVNIYIDIARMLAHDICHILLYVVCNFCQ